MYKQQIGSKRTWLGRLSCAIVILTTILILAGSTAAGGEQLPDFERMNVNSTSATHGQMVSPRDYLGKVSGWYFGHAT